MIIAKHLLRYFCFYITMHSMKKVNMEIELPVSIFREGSLFVAYTPALDLSTSAKTYEGAKKRFSNLIPIFMEELIKKGTMDEYLESLGWRKIQKKWLPPAVVFQGLEKIRMPQAV